jgi:hypothetical protein
MSRLQRVKGVMRLWENMTTSHVFLTTSFRIALRRLPTLTGVCHVPGSLSEFTQEDKQRANLSLGPVTHQYGEVKALEVKFHIHVTSEVSQVCDWVITAALLYPKYETELSDGDGSIMTRPPPAQGNALHHRPQIYAKHVSSSDQS